MNGILGHDNGNSVDFLMQDMEESRVRVERHVGHSSVLVTLLKPLTDFFDFLGDLKKIVGCFFLGNFFLVFGFFVVGE